MPQTRQKVTAKKNPPKKRQTGGAQVAGVTLTHPEKVLYPEQGVTKLALAEYYEEIADWILPQLRKRPLSLMRCPDGRGGECFYQKHPGQTLPADIPRIDVREKSGKKPYVYVEELRDLLALVQIGTLELHAWGSRVEDMEHPDTVVFDLDPGPGVSWKAVQDAARSLQDRVRDLKLEGYLRTTGGKGLHVVVPIKPKLEWDQVKLFARAVASAHAADDPGKFTTNMAKAKRQRRIFIDYLRNGRGATAIVSYSTRARKGAPVAVPVRRDELRPDLTSSRYDVGSVRRRLKALSGDPWADFDDGRRPISAAALRAVAARR